MKNKKLGSAIIIIIVLAVIALSLLSFDRVQADEPTDTPEPQKTYHGFDATSTPVYEGECYPSLMGEDMW